MKHRNYKMVAVLEGSTGADRRYMETRKEKDG